MTRSNKSEINLKSTAYNQTGQNYFQQLTAYNSMSAHLRRILLAKCVVDDRNKDYMYKRKQISKQNECKLQHLRIHDTNNIINRLPYNTLYHPMSFLRMYYDSRCLHLHDALKDNANSCNYDVVCARSKLYNHVMCASSLTVKTNDQESCTSNIKNLKLQSSTSSKQIFMPANAKNVLKIHDGREEKSVLQDTAYELQSRDSNNFSSTSYGNNECTQACGNVNDSSEVCVKNAEVKYAKFVYDITQEIILNGLYTDQELQEVFEKHVEANKKFLDMNRMQYEIDQLKIALYLSDNLEDFTHTGQPANTSTLYPSVPPKVFNENKTTEKLSCYKKLEGLGCKLSPISNKCVELIDANPELLVTDGDVLALLTEANINPEHDQQMYKSPSNKSKNTNPLTERKVKSIKDEFLIDEQCDNSVIVLNGTKNMSE